MSNTQSLFQMNVFIKNSEQKSSAQANSSCSRQQNRPSLTRAQTLKLSRYGGASGPSAFLNPGQVKMGMNVSS